MAVPLPEGQPHGQPDPVVFAGMTLAELWRLFPIQLRAPDPAWGDWYAAESARLRSRLGDRVAAVHHIGSTSVPGLVAKPIVDILLEVDPATAAEPLLADMEADGWQLMARQAPPGFRLDLNKGYTPTGFAERVFHLHVVRPGDDDEVVFADWLRTHPDTAAAYAALKRDLAAQHEFDRDAYTAGKTAFVRSVTDEARQQRSA